MEITESASQPNIEQPISHENCPINCQMQEERLDPIGSIGSLVSHLEEQQVRKLLHVVAACLCVYARRQVVPEDVTVEPIQRPDMSGQS